MPPCLSRHVVRSQPLLGALVDMGASEEGGWMAKADVIGGSERLWTIHDVSAFLAVPVGTIYQWRVRSEGPPAMRMGRHLRFDPEAVRRWAHDRERAC